MLWIQNVPSPNSRPRSLISSSFATSQKRLSCLRTPVPPSQLSSLKASPNGGRHPVGVHLPWAFEGVNLPSSIRVPSAPNDISSALATNSVEGEGTRSARLQRLGKWGLFEVSLGLHQIGQAMARRGDLDFIAIAPIFIYSVQSLFMLSTSLIQRACQRGTAVVNGRRFIFLPNIGCHRASHSWLFFLLLLTFCINTYL